MVATSIKYHGLCETCDHDATCTLKRSPRLEIIHCEQFTTQPVIQKQTPVPDKESPSAGPRSQGFGSGRGKRLTLADPI